MNGNFIIPKRVRKSFLVEEGESHVVVRAGFVSAVGFLFFGRSRFLLGGGGSSSWGGATGGRGGGAEVTEKRGDVDAVEGLGEKRGPVWLNRDAGGLQEGGDLVGGDGNAVIVKDEGGVDAGQFVVGCHLQLKSRK